MTQELQIFKHEEFGGVRVVEVEGEPHLAGIDVATALGYANPVKALADYVPDNFKKYVQGDDTSTPFISLNGLSMLVRNSNYTLAKEFEWWIATDVTLAMKTIWGRAEEYDMLFGNIDFMIDILRIYADKTETPRVEFLQLVLSKLAESSQEAKLNPSKKCVYILEMSNNTVKIGCTNNFRNRARQIETGSGLRIVNWCHTDYIPSQRAYTVESNCHKAFDERRIQGEFFNIAFNEACEELSKHENISDSKNL